MTLLRRWMVVSLVFVTQAIAAEPPAQPTQAPRQHHSACALAESMAGKLATKKMSAADVQRTCQQLAPTMSDADRLEFMRCCTARFQH